MKKRLFTMLLAAGSLIVAAQNSDKITRVLEYRPAPGQHINRFCFLRPNLAILTKTLLNLPTIAWWTISLCLGWAVLAVML